MKYLKNLGYSMLYIIVSIIFLTFIITFFNYFNILSDKTIAFFKIIIPVISLFIGGFYIGKNSSKKGFLEGIKVGVIFSIFLVIFNYLALNYSFKLKYLLFYIILISSSTLGSMVGINKKKS